MVEKEGELDKGVGVEELMNGYIEHCAVIESKFSLKANAKVKESCWQVNQIK
jgi:hypothetical protein